jgi:hypothetical protein
MRLIPLSLALAALALAACSKDAAPNTGVSQTEEAPAVAVVGKPAPSLTVSESYNWAGGVPNLAEMRGKVVVLDYWAYW